MLAFFILLELAARLIDVAALVGGAPDNPVLTRFETFLAPHVLDFERTPYVFDRELIYTLRPSFSGSAPNVVKKGLHWRMTIQPNGLRTVPASVKEDGEILALGDSISFGFLVSDEETYCAALQRLLRSLPVTAPLNVANGGVPGYDSTQGRIFCSRWLQKYRPKILILAYGMNDRSWKRQSRAEVLASFQKVAGPLEVLNHFELFRTLRRVLTRIRLAPPGDEQLQWQVAPETFQENLEAMIAQARDRQIDVILLDTFIVVEEPEYSAILAKTAEKHALPLVRSRSAIAEWMAKTWGEEAIRPVRLERVMWEEVHPNPWGHQAIAAALFREVTALTTRTDRGD